ncbi:hypothetical protein HMPREF7215_0396 [Pyramidobacter piscolens W5455]|uniref:Uncharacterized protein n=1 Tax=Pyramidobacter piscolens W5455 TaxID=352165 RepID=A0ABP2HVJ1_9BACT|nr:hypothetical protein HMPREF7215_0396 [Pyramidobacter piscolens W5455]
MFSACDREKLRRAPGNSVRMFFAFSLFIFIKSEMRGRR